LSNNVIVVLRTNEADGLAIIVDGIKKACYSLTGFGGIATMKR